MATATQSTSPAPSRVERPSDASTNGSTRQEHRCECGHVLRAVGNGRHRVYSEPGVSGAASAIINRGCPECGRPLPGKGRPYRAADSSRTVSAGVDQP
jgi:hypothetical protein